MIKARVGANFDRVVLGILPFVARIRLRPDTLTLIGVALSLVAGVAFACEALVLAGLLLLFAGFFDLIDGVVARAQGSSSVGGAFFDSSMDRLSDLFVLSGIAVGYAARGDAPGTALVCWALTGAVMTSYTRARAERHLSSFSVGWMERGERCVALILGALSGWLEVALWIVALGASLTSLQRLLAARRLLAELEVSGRDPTLEPAPAPAGGERS